MYVVVDLMPVFLRFAFPSFFGSELDAELVFFRTCDCGFGTS